MSRDSQKPLEDDERRLAEVTAQLIAKAEEAGLPDTPDKLGITLHAIRFLARAHLELIAKVSQPNRAVGSLEDLDALRPMLNVQVQVIQDRVEQIARAAIEGALREAARQQGGIATKQIVDAANSEGMLAAKPFIGAYADIINTFVDTMANARRRTFPCPHCGSVPGDNGVSGCATCLKPRVVLTPAEIAKLSGADLLAIYCRVMRETEDVFVKHESYVVRVWDGSDGCWTDCTRDIGRDEALRYWAEKTDGGTHHVAYAEMDYYRIFPGGTRMIWDGSEGREMHR